jgi:predicted DNA repair protein MutK
VAGASLLVLLDDIATVLDDVAVMSKVAARKTAGVLGDDLALNAQQVSGVRAEREIPVVWAVAKGSFRNKLILVPAALLISAFAPWLITPMLLVGGLFLCYEGFEKVVEKMFHSPQLKESELLDGLDKADDVVEFEKQKIKGAIRTDFVLSAEIIVIALGTVQEVPIVTQVLVISLIAVLMTIGVYGLVAGIVKLDDLGLYLVKNSYVASFKHAIGNALINAAPYLMKFLAVVGTIAMFLVGGGIVVHSIPNSHALVHLLVERVDMIPGGPLMLPALVNAVIGLLSGALVLAGISFFSRVKAMTKE